MDRRSMFGLFAAALIAGPSAVSRAYAVGEKKHRLAIHVDQSDIAQMNLALGNASNVFEHYKSRGEDVEIEIVTYAPRPAYVAGGFLSGEGAHQRAARENAEFGVVCLREHQKADGKGRGA